MKKAIVKTHIDTTLPFPDACTEAVHCEPGGACKYKLKNTNVIYKKNLLQNIAVNIARL